MDTYISPSQLPPLGIVSLDEKMRHRIPEGVYFFGDWVSVFSSRKIISTAISYEQQLTDCSEHHENKSLIFLNYESSIKSGYRTQMSPPH